MRRILAGFCSACLLAALLAIPSSQAPPRDWRALYCALVQEKFMPWFRTQRNPKVFSFDWFDIYFSLFDLNNDGTPELFIERTVWAGQGSDFDLDGAYTVMDGKLRKFQEGPQDTRSDARYYLRADQCGEFGEHWRTLTWYDFETCTVGGETVVNETPEEIEARTAAYGSQGRYKGFMPATTWFWAAEWFDALDPDAGPEISNKLPRSLYIRKNWFKGAADFCAAFTRAMEANLESSTQAYMADAAE